MQLLQVLCASVTNSWLHCSPSKVIGIVRISVSVYMVWCHRKCLSLIPTCLRQL